MIPGLGRSPRGGHGNPLQYPCLENHMDRGARQVKFHGVTESDTTKVLAFSLSLQCLQLKMTIEQPKPF